MAKFAELTSYRDGGRLLINPDHVAWVEPLGPTTGVAARSDVHLHGARPIMVRETSDEVLARLCYPVSPEPPEGAEGERREIGEIIYEIQAAGRRRDKVSDAEELAKVWELLESIEDRLKALL